MMRLIAITILSCVLVAFGLTHAGADQKTGRAAAQSTDGWNQLADGLNSVFLIPRSRLKSVIPNFGS
jgi:hypothetical protein